MDAATIIFPIMYLCGAAIYRGGKNSEGSHIKFKPPRDESRSCIFSKNILCHRDLSRWQKDKVQKN